MCILDVHTLDSVNNGDASLNFSQFPALWSDGFRRALWSQWHCDSWCLFPQARLNCKHCGKPVIDVRIGMQYFSEYSNVQQCPHCGNLDYHFVKPFSSFKVLEAYWWKLCFSNSYFIDIITLLHIFYRGAFCDINFFSNLKQSLLCIFVPLKWGLPLVLS